MATPYTDVYDLFMQQIKDYVLDELYASSEINFNTFLQGFLVLAINEFDSMCDQDLSDRNDTTGAFNFDLLERNQVILSRAMVKFWLEKEVQDVLQMKWNLQDRDFKHYSEAQNLKEKNDFLTNVTERVAQMYVDYQFEDVNWTNWGNGEFGV